MKQRAGFTLLETMFAMTLGTILVGGLALIVSKMVAVNQSAHEHTQLVANLGRFGEQFRADAHASQSFAIADKKLTVTPRDATTGTIEYELLPDGVQRQVRSGEQVRQREAYALPGFAPLAWNLSDQQNEVSLTVARRAQAGAAPQDVQRGTFQILAVAGRLPLGSKAP